MSLERTLHEIDQGLRADGAVARRRRLGRFSGMRTVIIGAARGIGRATAGYLHDNGAELVLGDIDEEAGRPFAKSLGSSFYPCNAAEYRNMRDFAHETRNWANSMILTAGLQLAGDTSQMEEHEIQALFAVNAFAPVLAGQHFGSELAQNPMLAEARGERWQPGALTIVASVAGLTDGGPGLSVYGASKGAAIAFGKSLAKELAPYVRVNVVCPGWTDTGFNRPAIDFMGGEEALRKRIEETVPLGRQAESYEIAEAIAWITSPEAAYVTGTTLVVDGGLTI